VKKLDKEQFQIFKITSLLNQLHSIHLRYYPVESDRDHAKLRITKDIKWRLRYVSDNLKVIFKAALKSKAVWYSLRETDISPLIE